MAESSPSLGLAGLTEPAMALPPALRREFSDRSEHCGVRDFVLARLRELEARGEKRVLVCCERSSHLWGYASEDSDWDVHAICLPLRPSSAWAGMQPQQTFVKRVHGPRSGTEVGLDVELSEHDCLRFARLMAKRDLNALEILRSPLVYFGGSGPEITALYKIAIRTIYGWLGVARAYLDRCHSVIKQIRKMKKDDCIKSIVKQRKKMGYALHYLLSAEWLLSRRDLEALPMDVPTLLEETETSDSGCSGFPSLSPCLAELAIRLTAGARGLTALQQGAAFSETLDALGSRRAMMLDAVESAFEALSCDASRLAAEGATDDEVNKRLNAWIRSILAEELQGTRCSLSGRSIEAHADAQARSRPLLVVSLGIVVLDTSFVLNEFPREDTKVVSKRVVVGGGGNAPNSAVAMARLLPPGYATVRLLSKVGGSDAAGEQCIRELRDEGIDTSFMVRSAGGITPMSSILVAGSSRTIVNAPGLHRTDPLAPDEVPTEALHGARLLHLDGRHSDAALHAAQIAVKSSMDQSDGCDGRNVTAILLECERPRNGLMDLLALADIVVFSQGCASKLLPDSIPLAASPQLADPGALRRQCCLVEAVAMSRALEFFAPRAHTAVVTLGAFGAVVIRRNVGVKKCAAPRGWPARDANRKAFVGGPDLVALEGWRDNSVVSFQVAHSIEAWSSANKSEMVVDTTGAGDAFIGAFCAGVAFDLPLTQTVQLASYVAWSNCRVVGPRGGMPQFENLPHEIQNALLSGCNW